jgi:hypothetical protein
MADFPSRMGAPGTWTKADIPLPWDPAKAITFFDAVNLVDVYLDPALPISRELVVLFYFHETAFSNIRQKTGATQKNPRGLGPGVGFGQMEILRSDKPAFIESLYGRKPTEQTFDEVTSDEHFAIRLHCAYLRYLFARGATTKKALVAGQTGGGDNAGLQGHFVTAETKLQSVIYSQNRQGIINALNSCRWYLKRNPDGSVVHDDKGVAEQHFEPIAYPSPKFKKYWDFTLPESELVWGIRK